MARLAKATKGAAAAIAAAVACCVVGWGQGCYKDAKGLLPGLSADPVRPSAGSQVF